MPKTQNTQIPKGKRSGRAVTVSRGSHVRGGLEKRHANSVTVTSTSERIIKETSVKRRTAMKVLADL